MEKLLPSPPSRDGFPSAIALATDWLGGLRRVSGCTPIHLVLSPWANTETTTAELHILITVDGISLVSLPQLQEEQMIKSENQ